jgi:DNA-directed RNA polymerase specialized sigma subunit
MARKPKVAKSRPKAKNKVSQWMGHQRWKGTTRQERSDYARRNANKFWETQSEAERAAWARRLSTSRWKNHKAATAADYRDAIAFAVNRRERDILKRLGGGDTLAAVAKRYKISRERVRQIAKKVLIRMAESKTAKARAKSKPKV